MRTVLFGLGLVVAAVRRRAGAPPGWVARWRWPRWVRLSAAVAALVLAAGGVAASVAIHRAAPGAPGAFYRAPSPLPGDPEGTILRQETVAGLVAGATTYRVLYLSSGYDGKPTAVSGLIIVPDGAAPPGGRKILAYTHGTTGVASNCAPSLVTNPLQQPLLVEGGEGFVRAGYVIAASDYQGLGTRGPHPYLVGKSEAENELDIVRAAHNLPAAHAGTAFAVWGHSQGGQAALFTGQLAASYAPDLQLVGVAAGGPVPNLTDLFAVNITNPVGRILIAMALQSWARVYHDAHLDQIVTPAARPLIAKIAGNCLYNQTQILASVPAALALKLTFLHTPPWQVEPWKTILADNNPGQTPTGKPILLIQGAADTIVTPDVTQRLADTLCTHGQTVDLRTLPSVGHLETGHLAAPDVTSWIAERFTGTPAPTTCPT